MMLPHIFADSTGHSQLGEIELAQTARQNFGASAALQDVSYWQMSVSEPGDFIDFQTTDMNKVIAVLSGQVDITVSNGDVIRLARGDMLFQTDVSGQGHQMNFVGLEPCMTLQMAMPGGLKS